MSEEAVQRLMGLADAYAFPKSFVISGDGITASATDMEAARSTLESALREVLKQPLGVPAAPSGSVVASLPSIPDATC